MIILIVVIIIISVPSVMIVIVVVLSICHYHHHHPIKPNTSTGLAKLKSGQLKEFSAVRRALIMIAFCSRSFVSSSFVSTLRT